MSELLRQKQTSRIFADRPQIRRQLLAALLHQRDRTTSFNPSSPRVQLHSYHCNEFSRMHRNSISGRLSQKEESDVDIHVSVQSKVVDERRSQSQFTSFVCAHRGVGNGGYGEHLSPKIREKVFFRHISCKTLVYFLSIFRANIM